MGGWEVERIGEKIDSRLLLPAAIPGSTLCGGFLTLVKGRKRDENIPEVKQLHQPFTSVKREESHRCEPPWQGQITHLQIREDMVLNRVCRLYSDRCVSAFMYK